MGHIKRVTSQDFAEIKKMPEARLELAQGFNSPTDFKSGASADSATRAL